MISDYMLRKKVNKKVDDASEYFLKKQYDKVIVLLKDENISDDTHAMMILGESYRKQGDYDIAYDYLRGAYDKGNVNATYGLAKIILDGSVVEKDVEEAYLLLRKAAFAGNRQAMLEMAEYCHDNDMSIGLDTQNRPEEKMWREHAQELPSCSKLWYHAQNMIYNSYDKGSSNEEIEEAILLAAVKGSEDAKLCLAKTYAKHMDDKVSLKKSLYWFYSLREMNSSIRRKLKEVEEALGLE